MDFKIDYIKARTAKAVLVVMEDETIQTWLPLSQIEIDGETVRVPMWLARKLMD